MNRRHQNDNATFEDLDFIGQSRAINICVTGFKEAINAHLRRARLENRDVESVRARRVDQLRRLVDQVERL